MGLAFLEKVGNTSTPGEGGLNINGIIEQYYVYAGDNISAGDFVNFVEGVANRTITHGVTVDTTETIINSLYRQYAYKHKAFLLSDQKRVILIHSYDNDLHMQLLSVENGVISTLGSRVELFSDQRENCDIIEIEPNKLIFIGIANDSYKQVLKMVTVGADNSLTINTTVTLSTTAYGTPVIHKVGENKIFAAYGGKPSTANAKAVIATIDGTTINLGPTTDLGVSATLCTSAKLNNNQILLVLVGPNTTACYCNIDDMSITPSAMVQINTVPNSWQTSLLLLNPTTALYMFDDETDMTTYNWPLRGQFIYLGPEITYSEMFTIDNNTLAGYSLEAIQLSNGKIIIFDGVYPMDGSDPYTSIIVCEYVNNALAELTRTTFSSTKYGTKTGQNTSVSLFENDDFCFTYDDSSGDLMAGQIFSLNNETNLIVPIAHKSTVETVYETQVQKSVTDVFNGIAKTSGVGGDSMGHNQQIEIYTL